MSLLNPIVSYWHKFQIEKGHWNNSSNYILKGDETVRSVFNQHYPKLLFALGTFYFISSLFFLYKGSKNDTFLLILSLISWLLAVKEIGSTLVDRTRRNIANYFIAILIVLLVPLSIYVVSTGIGKDFGPNTPGFSDALSIAGMGMYLYALMIRYRL